MRRSLFGGLDLEGEVTRITDKDNVQFTSICILSRNRPKTVRDLGFILDLDNCRRAEIEGGEE